MASTTGQVVQATGEGAVTGGITGGPWGALIGGVVGLLGGVVGARAERRAQEEREELERRIKRELGIKMLRRRTARLLPIERGAAISELKGRVEGQTAANLARKGLTGTGAGEALRGISTAITDIEANRRAVEGARSIGVNKSRALGAEIERIVPSASPAERALIGLVRGALLASTGARRAGAAPRAGIDEATPDMSAARARLLLGSAPEDFDYSAYDAILPGLRP